MVDLPRGTVTFLFTDIEGFTAMTHRAGPEELVATLDEYFEDDYISDVPVRRKPGHVFDTFTSRSGNAVRE